MGVTWYSAEPTRVLIHWWPRSDSFRSMQQLNESLKRRLSLGEKTGAASATTAAMNSMPPETWMTPVEDVQAPTTSSSERSEMVVSPTKRVRSTEGPDLPGDP